MNVWGLFIIGVCAYAFTAYQKNSAGAMSDAVWSGDITAGDSVSDAVDVNPAVTPDPYYSDIGVLISDTWDMNYPTDLSANGLETLKKREGFSDVPYPDHKGFSIGHGHLIKPGENLTFVTREQAAAILTDDVSWAVAAVFAGVKVSVTQNQFDALVSFCFNVGAGAFAASTLLKKVNALDPNAWLEFKRWVYASKQVNPSLIARRESEINQFLA